MIIILGSNGMLGRYVLDYLKFKCRYPVFGITHTNLNATDISLVRKMMDRIVNKGDIIINCIGITKERRVSTTQEIFLLNSILPHILDNICTKKSARLLQPRPEYVFTGKKGGYINTDIPDNTDDYGLSNSIGEKINASSILRTSILSDYNGNYDNLIGWCKENNGKKVDGYTNHFCNPITCLEWAKLVERIITEEDWWVGIRNYCSKYGGKDFVSKDELMLCINNVYDLNMKINPVCDGDRVDYTLKGHVVETDLIDQIKELKDYQLSDKPSMTFTELYLHIKQKHAEFV